MRNLELARILYSIADILEFQGIEFKPQAYRKAAHTIEELSEDIKNIPNLEELPGIGKSIAGKINDFIRTGKIKYYEQLKKDVGIDLKTLKGIPFLGPKKIKFLHEKLKIRNIADLQKAIAKKKLHSLPGFGEESEHKIAEGIKTYLSQPKRYLYTQVSSIVQEITNYFQKHSLDLEVAGSFKRGKETIGDLDFISTSPKAMKLFLSIPDIQKILAQGNTKCSVLLKSGLQLDLRIITKKELGSAEMHFIGSKEHNIEMRKLALSKGYTLNEYGLFKQKNKQWIAGKTQEEIYQKLGLDYIEPELRENLGEIEAAIKHKLPKLVELFDLNGVFHNHTDWSDGSNTIEEMLAKAKMLKLSFISFNDHVSQIGITNPLNEKRLNKYIITLDKIKKKSELEVFSGIEIDILKDGTLPLTKKKLREIDVVIAAVHLSTKMDSPKMTKRICFALENYPIHILGHPTGRLLLEREPFSLNLDKIFETAKATSTFLEINSSPQRMDLPSNHIKSAKEYGCQFALGTDAHSLAQLETFPQGILNCRRGWLEKKDLLNCWEIPKIKKALQKN